MGIFSLFNKNPSSDVADNDSGSSQSSATPNDTLNITPYPAAELIGLQNWINSQPLTLDELKGRVVLVDFWTFGCINCVRTLPHAVELYEKYKDQGFVLLGVHTPEFDAEKVPERVAQSVKDRKITYPVAQDNQMQTWEAYDNHYWPTQYLIDKDGMVRRTHFGEGEYQQTDQAVARLLSE